MQMGLLRKARELPKQQFRSEVETELARGRKGEPWEIIYFKLYKSQIPVIEQALETAALMLGSDKFSWLCLEMICARRSKNAPRPRRQLDRYCPVPPTWQELFMELVLDPDRSQISERVQAVIHAIVRRYREPEPLTAQERSAIDLALETMARWTL
jgi:hypothetical protein